MPNLTLLILAYNRPQELCRLLTSIISSLDHCSTPHSVSLIIAYNEPIPVNNNCHVLNRLSSHPRLSSFDTLSRPVNLRLDTHLALAYSSCQPGYIWFLSDDDIIYDYSLEFVCTIIQDIASKTNINSFPPVYLNWISQHSRPPAPPLAAEYHLLSPLQFTALKRSTFFLSATIAYKDSNFSSFRIFDGFSHYSCLLSQILDSDCIVVVDYPAVGFDSQCQYQDQWLYLFLVALPLLFDHFISLGFTSGMVRNITAASLFNRTGVSTMFFLASKIPISSRLFYLSSVYHWSSYYPVRFLLIVPFLFALAPLFQPLRFLRRLFVAK